MFGKHAVKNSPLSYKNFPHYFAQYLQRDPSTNPDNELKVQLISFMVKLGQEYGSQSNEKLTHLISETIEALFNNNQKKLQITLAILDKEINLAKKEEIKQSLNIAPICYGNAGLKITSLKFPYDLKEIYDDLLKNESKNAAELSSDGSCITIKPLANNIGICRKQANHELAFKQSVEATSHWVEEMKWSNVNGHAGFHKQGIGIWPNQKDLIFFTEKFFIIEGVKKYQSQLSDPHKLQAVQELLDQLINPNCIYQTVFNENKPIINELKKNKDFYEVYNEVRFLKVYGDIETLIEQLNKTLESAHSERLKIDLVTKISFLETLRDTIHGSSLQVGEVAHLAAKVKKLSSEVSLNGDSSEALNAIVSTVLRSCNDPFTEFYKATQDNVVEMIKECKFK